MYSESGVSQSASFRSKAIHFHLLYGGVVTGGSNLLSRISRKVYSKTWESFQGRQDLRGLRIRRKGNLTT